MTVVKINAIEVPPGAGPELEKRFSNRAHAVDGRHDGEDEEEGAAKLDAERLAAVEVEGGGWGVSGVGAFGWPR
jgi:heme-degrading monooxygenase HmoA